MMKEVLKMMRIKNKAEIEGKEVIERTITPQSTSAKRKMKGKNEEKRTQVQILVLTQKKLSGMRGQFKYGISQKKLIKGS